MKIEIHRHPGTPPDRPTATTLTHIGQHHQDRIHEIQPDAAARVVVREVFNGLTLITADRETVSIVMRDSGFELAYQVDEEIVHVDLQRGEVHHSNEPQDHMETIREALGVDKELADSQPPGANHWQWGGGSQGHVVATTPDPLQARIDALNEVMGLWADAAVEMRDMIARFLPKETI